MSVIRWQAQARCAETTVPCHVCGACLMVERSCQDVWAVCKNCGRKVSIGDVIGRADEAMEHFLENLYCDRI